MTKERPLAHSLLADFFHFLARYIKNCDVRIGQNGGTG